MNEVIGKLISLEKYKFADQSLIADVVREVFEEIEYRNNLAKAVNQGGL